MGHRMMPFPKPLGLILAFVFALTGLAFLFLPSGVISFFNRLSAALGFQQAPTTQAGFYLILAVGYMAVVTLLAWLIFRHPDDARLPLILAFAKFTSSLLSFAFFFSLAPYLLYLSNGVVDGLIGAVVLFFRPSLMLNKSERR